MKVFLIAALVCGASVALGAKAIAQPGATPVENQPVAEPVPHQPAPHQPAPAQGTYAPTPSSNYPTSGTYPSTAEGQPQPRGHGTYPPTYQPQQYPQRGYAPIQVLPLSSADIAILRRGRISGGQFVAGGALGTFMGFGLGHAVQGRWSEKGWIFTVGEVGSFFGFFAGLGMLADGDIRRDEEQEAAGASLVIASAVGLVVFRIWEIVDVWGGAASHNRRHDDAYRRAYPGSYYPQPRYGFSILPNENGGGSAALSMKF